MSGVYNNPYAVKEVNFSLSLALDNQVENIIALNVGDVDVMVEVLGGYFVRPLETAGAISTSIDAEVLAVPVVDGTLLVAGVDFLSADKEIEKIGNPIPEVELYKDATVDRTGARNILRTQGHADRRETNYTPNLAFKYRLKRNTSYAFIVTHLEGTPVSDVEGILYGTITQLSE